MNISLPIIDTKTGNCLIVITAGTVSEAIDKAAKWNETRNATIAKARKASNRFAVFNFSEDFELEARRHLSSISR